MKINVVGAGISGLAAAVLLSEKGHDVEVFETKPYVGGHCADEWRDCEGERILVPLHGDHIFHTSYEDVWRFVSRYTKLNDFQHHIVSLFDGAHIPMPFLERIGDFILSLKNIGKTDAIICEINKERRGIMAEAALGYFVNGRSNRGFQVVGQRMSTGSGSRGWSWP